MKRKLLFIILILGSLVKGHSQDIGLYQQFNGRYDFTFIGNTLNVAENHANDPCLINTSSSASLALGPGDQVLTAYLYWAGSGPGEFAVKLNGVDITAQRTFGLTWANTGLPFFSAFADVTSQVQVTGNGVYTLSDLDIAPFLNLVDYCSNGTNFGGWAIIIIYENNTLPLNQLNLYDGLQSVPYLIDITLNSLNVIDNQDAKIGFLAWEGDKALAFNESLSINGNDIGNPPLNPPDNAFNGTNSFAAAPDNENLYNMDMDVYNIENNINIGDTTAAIQLTSGMENVAVSTDFVMINTIITKLNSQLPDATISIDSVMVACRSRSIIVDFTVYNVNSTNDLPAGVPISIYANGVFIGYTETLGPIAIGGSVTDQITLIIPDDIADNFELTFVVDDQGNGIGIVTELLETNNTDTDIVSFYVPPPFNIAPDLYTCNRGLTSGVFDFSSYEVLSRAEPGEVV
ncbi:MAG TPA: gliding motility-associated C-terminal domain-containing protein, partial [Flavobacterium sp.]